MRGAITARTRDRIDLYLRHFFRFRHSNQPRRRGERMNVTRGGILVPAPYEQCETDPSLLRASVVKLVATAGMGDLLCTRTNSAMFLPHARVPVAPGQRHAATGRFPCTDSPSSAPGR